jgi:hypothetical protein
LANERARSDLLASQGMKRDDQATDTELPGESPVRVPLFGTWRRAYAMAILLFAVEIVLLYLFTHYFS